MSSVRQLRGKSEFSKRGNPSRQGVYYGIAESSVFPMDKVQRVMDDPGLPATPTAREFLLIRHSAHCFQSSRLVLGRDGLPWRRPGRGGRSSTAVDSRRARLVKETNTSTCHRQEVTENRGSENIWLKIRARPKLTTRIFGHLWPVTSTQISCLKMEEKSDGRAACQGWQSDDWEHLQYRGVPDYCLAPESVCVSFFTFQQAI